LIDFDTLVHKTRNDKFIPITTLALDPGDTTGIAVFSGTELVHAEEVMGDHATMAGLFNRFQPTVVVAEEYRIYETHARVHIHSTVPTLRLIGGIEMLCHLSAIPLYMYGAGRHKPFSTDDKLKAWGFYQNTYRHANDAIRVGMYHIIFGE